jgi:CheY-like chemotaxis protein
MPASVLIVDPSAENREVLRTVLARRGLRIFEADAAAAGLELAREHQPDVVVLDVEAEAADPAAMSEQLTANSPEHPPELIVLGKFRRQSSPAGHVISKPYHFAPLVHKIEQLAAKAA